ncbi:hypothetical protein TWF694_002096 [Orbilia ellipsospora]|uniref:F-box domain-containing protein n=1 Tax=Orbilia ellipsospora TaxID=2528407 RepID=A0AAV9X739_9PEZI
MQHFLFLPTEIRRLILGYLPLSDLSKICLVSKSMYDVAIPILYSTILLRPHATHGIEPHQSKSLLPVSNKNRHARHIHNIYVIRPSGQKGVADATVKITEFKLMTIVKPNQLFSLSLCGSIRSESNILPFLGQQQSLRAIHLDIPPSFDDAEAFSRLGGCGQTLRTLSLRILKAKREDLDILSLIKLLKKLRNLRSLDLQFRERGRAPPIDPIIWNQGVLLLDAIFGIKSLRELILLGNDIPFGYWANGNPNKRVLGGLTLFKTETVDRGDSSDIFCNLDDKFFFECVNPRTFKCWHFCLGVIYPSFDFADSQYERYVHRNNKLQKLLAECEALEELRVCNLPQMSDYNPANHCLFRARDTLKRLRICSNDWYGMNFLDPWMNEHQYQERQTKIIQDLTALQVLELTINWLDWNISSDSLQLVHILREPDYMDWLEQDLRPTIDEHVLVPNRASFLTQRATQFFRLVKPSMLPAIKVIVFSHLHFFEEHCNGKRYNNIQDDTPQRYPMFFALNKAPKNAFDIGTGQISASELEFRYPWLYDGSWEGKPWDDSSRFW